MKPLTFLSLLLTSLLPLLAAETKKPNILFIVADDLGFPLRLGPFVRWRLLPGEGERRGEEETRESGESGASAHSQPPLSGNPTPTVGRFGLRYA